jgi:carboxyl-terminal processing protease
LKAGDEMETLFWLILRFASTFKGAKNTKIDIKYIRQGKTSATQIVLDEVEIKSVPCKK